MSKNIVYILVAGAVVAAAVYVGLQITKNKQANTVQVTETTDSTTTAVSANEKERPLNLDFDRPSTRITQEQAPEAASTQEAKAAELKAEETPATEAPAEITIPTKQKRTKPAAVQQENSTINREKRAEDKVKVFEDNMEQLQKQADEELSKMSPEERAEVERNMEEVQAKMAETMERLEKMSPEERERELQKMEEEKNKVMEVLEKENPEAYKMFKSMEEMGDALDDLPLEAHTAIQN